MIVVILEAIVAGLLLLGGGALIMVIRGVEIVPDTVGHLLRESERLLDKAEQAAREGRKREAAIHLLEAQTFQDLAREEHERFERRKG